MNPKEFAYIQNFLLQKTGNVLELGKEYLVNLRLTPVAKKEGYSSISELIQQLQNFPTKKLEQQIVEAMTINETLFFRDQYPYKLLEKSIIPILQKKRSISKTLRIWSAGCSSGQEPYSIAILLAEYFEEIFATWNIQILATDISTPILEKAKSGIYTSFEIKRGLPEYSNSRFPIE